MMISQEIINMIEVMRGTSTLSNGNGKINGDGKMCVVEESAIGDELAGGWCQYTVDEYKLAVVKVE